MEFYLLNYFKPAVHQQTDLTRLGRALMDGFGCTSCHKATPGGREGSARRRRGDALRPARAASSIGCSPPPSPLFVEVASGGGLPPLRKPAGGRFVVENFFADLKRHDLGPNFHERNFDGSFQKEFMTEPLWGVGSTPPYGHDGRSINLHEVILRHGGEAEGARRRYASAGSTGQQALLAFLESLVLFPPDDTASNLNPGDRTAAGFPQQGHGNIRLPVLFLDPTELE